MAEKERDPSEDPMRSVDQDLPENAPEEPVVPVGPSVAGPAVAAGTPATGDSVMGTDTPSEAQIALEREVKETRARPGR